MRICIVLLLSTVITAYSQSDHRFTQGLVVSDCHRYGREAIVTDQIAYQLYTGKFKTPAQGQTLFTNSQGVDQVWKSIQVDSTGKFRSDAFTNGYLYLSYNSDRAQRALINISGNSMVYVNGEPHAGDIYGDGWMYIPVALKRGNNDLLIRCSNFSRWQGVTARLVLSDKPIKLLTDDITLPHIVVGKSTGELVGAVVVLNSTDKPLNNVTITTNIDGKATVSKVPNITKESVRKVPFTFSPIGIRTKGDYTYTITLKQNAKILDEQKITISAVNQDEHQSYTFISDIDGSVQYYSVAPSTGTMKNPALFLSVHGAGVQAIGQARAYQPKDWGVLVAPTNRRPRGFNWEDWGRMDALEVFRIAKEKFQPDPEKIYLTGHSMGGHGTWYLGATFPDQWAAIAPCAGYPTLTGYGSADGKIPNQALTEEEKILRRASNASNVVDLARNYKGLGVYIHHGDDDEVVSVDYARQMRKVLGEFHNDFSYYEYPGGSHWFGNESVDWAPIFEFFKWHTLKHDSAINQIDFITANPGVSSKNRWASIVQQDTALSYSEIHLKRDKKSGNISGSTKNVALLQLNTSFLNPGDSIDVTLDSVVVKTVTNEQGELWLSGFPQWKVTNKVSPSAKNPLRYGTFKEAFNHKMMFVYGTHGTADENRWAFSKARYDAEVWYYRGNGSVDIISDDEFESSKHKDRGIIVYGNAKTNSAWKKLLSKCPINVTSDRITAGTQIFQGNDLATYFTWPREDSDIAMIGVVSGTGLAGMKATDPNQYFAAGSGFPDFLIFSSQMLERGASGIKATGFFDNNWNLQQTVTRNQE